MKINVEIECTPEEARTFFGLPDVQPMQKRLLSTVEERMQRMMTETDPAKLMELWLPTSARAFEQWQSLWRDMVLRAAESDRQSERDE